MRGMPLLPPEPSPPAGLVLPAPAATAALGTRLAPLLRAGDVIGLEGALGAGKSLLARAILQARMAADGVPVEDVPSPTFTLVQIYHLPTIEIWHADLYRLAAPGEAVELGLPDAFDTAACLVEWPERMGALWPRDAITLTLAPGGGDARVLHARGPAGHPVIEALDD